MFQYMRDTGGVLGRGAEVDSEYLVFVFVDDRKQARAGPLVNV